MPPGGGRSSADAREPSTDAAVVHRVRLQAPPLRGGELTRSRLLDRIAAAPQPVIVVSAPAGYGKTTLLSQVAQRTSRVAYVRLDATDDDPIALLHDLVDAIEAVLPLEPGLREAVAAPAEFTAFRGPARFTQAIAQVEPFLLILDDVHLVRSRTARDWLVWILERLPGGGRAIVAGRGEVGLPLGRLLAADALLELSTADLALDARETEQLAELIGVRLDPAAVQALTGRTEGWPLATTLLLRAGAAADPRQAERLVGEDAAMRYLRSELVDAMDAETLDFVLRSAALEEMTGPLCDAALETTGSLRMLRSLEGQNQLLLPLDGPRTTYRYHALYRELLLTELEAALPGERTRVVVRAAYWLEAQGRVEEAARLVASVGNLDLLASFVERYGARTFWAGRIATARDWCARFDHDGVRERYVTVAYMGAWCEAWEGNATRMARWVAAVEHSTDRRPLYDGSADDTPWVSIIRAHHAPDGMAAFEADVDRALATTPITSILVPQLRHALVVRAIAKGDLDAADALAREGDEILRAYGAWPGLVFLCALRAVVALARGDITAAHAHATASLGIIDRLHVEDFSYCGLTYAVAARVAAHQGRIDDARAMLVRVNRMRPVSSVALPWPAFLMRIHGVRAAIAMRESAIARTLLSELDDLLRVRPDMGALNAEIETLRPIVDALRTAQPGPWTLTAAELRLLAYLPTHLTFREIAERMYLSPHTIKTQAMSIYGKLEVSSRREAIERAVAVGLLDASVLHQAEDAALIA